MNVVVKVLISDLEGNVLLLRRSATHPTLAFEMDLPGGLVDPGETHDEALLREVMEETGMSLRDMSHVYERISAYGYLHRLYESQLSAIKPQIDVSWEHDRYEWVPRDMFSHHLGESDEYMVTVKKYLRSHYRSNLDVYEAITGGQSNLA